MLSSVRSVKQLDLALGPHPVKQYTFLAMHTQPPARLAVILKRELDAEDAFITEDTDLPASDTAIMWPLSTDRTLVVTFASPPADVPDKHARLAALSESFADLFAEALREVPKARPEPAITLKSELDALAGRAHADIALIIDAKSPVVWGASEAATNADDQPIDPVIFDAFAHAKELGISWRQLLAQPPTLRNDKKEAKLAADAARLLHLVPPVDELAGLSAPEKEILNARLLLGRNVIGRLRANPILPELHRGDHLHEAIREDSLGYIARSFATIYVLILVFPGHFDELGAERAMSRALPTIEKLVVSLPPDDTPNTRQGAVVALRPRRR